MALKRFKNGDGFAFYDDEKFDLVDGKLVLKDAKKVETKIIEPKKSTSKKGRWKN